MLCQWRVRKKGQEANPYEDYREFPSVFCLKINHGGTFTPPPMTRYKGGKVNWVDDIDSDTFSIAEVTSMLQELGYENPCMAYYYKKPNSELENGLVELVVDKDVYEMLMYVDKFKVIELYTDHTVKKQHVLTQEPLATIIDVTQPDSSSGNEAEVDVSEDEWLRESLKKLPIKSKKGQQSSRKEVGQSSRNGSGSENGSGSDSGSDSEDSDYFVDEENLIEDVDVDMAEFKRHTDPGVEWLGCKENVLEENEVFELEEVDHEEFDSGSDSDEGVRRKALRKVARMNKAIQGKGERVYKEDFFLGEQFATSQVPDFANNDMGSVIPFTGDQNGPISKVKPKSISKKEKVAKPRESYACPWAMQVSKLPNEDTWEVRTLKDTHTCLQSRIVSKCTATFLSKDVEETIKPNDKITLNTLKDQLQKKFEVGVSKQKVFRAKKWLMKELWEAIASIKIEVEPPEDPDSEERKFKRIYICLGPLKDGFKAGGRDFLGLDGCFLSGPYPGQILTAVGVDPNNGIYPLAYAVVESESKDSWKWFLDCLGDDLELFRNSNFTFISDRQKGVIPAIAENFPKAEHRFCLKHIYDNMKLSWRGKFYKEMLWKCATASTIQKFDKRMEEMKNHNLEAYEWLRKIPPQHWARAKSNILLNNLCEVLNRQLLDGRDKPIITCLEYIREYLMKRIVNVQKVQDKCDGPLTPSTAKIFKLIVRAAAKLKVEWNGSDLYQVTCPWGDQFVVNLSERVCSCRKWELSGIPCTHAVASIWDQANNGIDTGIPESYCLPVHWLTTWKEMYKFKINPVNGPQGWKKSDVPTTIIPPKPHPQIGRPPKKRKKSAAELADEMMKSKKLTKTGKSVTCKSCKQVGHNSRGCKSKKGGGSQQAGVAGHGDAAHGSQQAGVHGSQTTQSTPQAS
ncbi:mutator type transposase [Tanacetum coccineum]